MSTLSSSFAAARSTSVTSFLSGSRALDLRRLVLHTSVVGSSFRENLVTRKHENRLAP